ncbi:MAG TPA: TIGR01777 family oxidoreductase, partial [Marmoricola sp.]|nr:TIGR01777 family oxidoreductase [Marmoricola sp.]
PAGRRWVAQHEVDAYREGEQFVDVLASRPLILPIAWRHVHEFRDDPAGMLMVDTVETTVPDRLLNSMFRYRHHQLAADIASMQWSRDLHPQRLTIAISGASGTVGSALAPFLRVLGHRVITLVRRPSDQVDERQWNPASPSPDLLDDVDAVVHLAGATVAGRFSDAHRAAIRDSRIEPTRRLVAVAETCGVSTFVCASAIGFYGSNRADEELTEESVSGEGFLADVVHRWEAAAQSSSMRTVQVRTGIVQSPRGGALAVQLPLFRAGIGGPMGSGSQWQAWIGLDDLLDIYLRAVVDERLHGPVNAVAPNPVRQRDYARTHASVLNRPSVITTPAMAVRVALGAEGAAELPLASQRVLPAALQRHGHAFRATHLEPALRHLLGRERS